MMASSPDRMMPDNDGGGEPGDSEWRRRRWSPPLAVVLVVLVTVIVWSIVGWNLHRQRHMAETDAYADASNLARGFAESVNRTFEAMDQVFALLRAFHRADPARFDIRALAPSEQILNDLTLQMAVTDARGMMTASNLGGPPVDLSDREHIRIHLDTPGDFLFVSKPVLGRVSGKWSIQLTRKLFAPDGGMAGVLVISLDPSYFARFYEAFNPPGGTISLLGQDGVYRAHAPVDTRVPGTQVGPATMAMLRGVSEQGTYRMTSALDGVDRFHAYQQLPKYGVAVLVGIASSNVFAGYERDRVWFILGGACVSGIAILLGLLLIRLARRLVRSQQALSITLENISQGIVMVDSNDRVPVINRRAVELLNLPAALGRPGGRFRDVLDWQLSHREFADASAATTDVAALAQSGGLGPSVYERRRPNGTVLEVQTRQLPSGAAVRTYTDITDRKRNETALAAARDAAEAASSARADFMATMSHEIRTPLNAVIGLAELLLDSDLPPHPRRFAAMLRDAADSLLQTVNDILDFSKLDAERMELASVALDLPQLVAGVVDLMEVKAAEKGLQLRLQVTPADPPGLLGDPARLRQVLLNLVANAIKFTAAGSVEIHARLLPLMPRRMELQITVTDTGIGIPEEALERVFEPFSQVDGSISRRYGGSGLGLAICRRLLERMGGAISLQSATGEGSTFTLAVPVDIDPAPRSERELAVPGRSTVPARPLRILLAEDNPTNRTVATTRLEMMGHLVDVVADGAAALAAVQQVTYDLVLMDVMMPVVDGLAATRAIRALADPAAAVPIVALTANVFQSHQDACRAAGMDDFLAKPLIPAQLARMLARAMAGTLRTDGFAATTPPDSMLDLRARLTLDFGEAAADDVVRSFLDESRQHVAAMHDALEQGDPVALEKAVRALHDTAATLGLSTMARSVARMIDDPETQTAPGLEAIAALMTEMAATLRQTDDQPALSQDSRLR